MMESMTLYEVEQPSEMDFSLADGVFIKSANFKDAGTVVPQHSHTYDHSSFIATGSAKVWCEDEYLGEIIAPNSVFIKAMTKHTFITTSPNTLLLCIHNVSRSGDIDLHELHELKF